jgi:photosystem II stability/assembly factor-like uncharacterized protein
MKKIFLFFLLSFIVFIHQPLTFTQWVQTAGPAGGNISSLVSDGEYIYAGMQGGIYVSSDNGATWLRRNTGLSDLGITSITASNGIVLAGTISAKVFRSTNAGLNWQVSSNGLPYSSIKFVAKAESIYFAANYNSIYRSSNTGIDWIPSSSGIPNLEPNAFYYNDSLCWVGTNNGVFVSTDFGNSWSERSLGLNNKKIKDFTSTGEYIFVLTEAGCYRSNNQGMNWQESSSGLISAFTGKLESIDGNIFAALGSYGIFISTDSGNSWNAWGYNFPPTNTSALMFNDSLLFAGTTSGIYANDYPDQEWLEMNNNLYAANVSCMILIDSVIYAGAENGKVYRTADKGETWNYSFAGYNSNRIITMAAKGDTIYASSGWLLYYSTDSGQTWFQTNLYASQITAIAIRGSEIYAATAFIEGILLSTDGGITWQQRNNGLTNINLNALAVDEQNVYAGTLEGLFISSNSGNNWVKAGNGIPQNIGVVSLKSTGNHIYAGAIYGLYRSSDFGNTWSLTGFSNQIVECIEAKDNYVFAGTSTSGIYMSSTYGGSWSAKNNGLPIQWPRSLLLADNTLLAGIYGHSVWRNTSLITSIDQYNNSTPDNYILHQNYPNPFNPSTRISWQSPVGSHQTIKVFDVLGREVATLVDEFRNAGYHEVDFNSAGLASGVYYYQLKAGSFMETKKMILTK